VANYTFGDAIRYSIVNPASEAIKEYRRCNCTILLAKVIL
jgi:hypothetical protein